MGRMDAPHHTQTASAIRALEAYGCLSDEQLARVTEQRPGSVRKRMVKLQKAGKVLRISHRRGRAGRPKSVSCLPGSNWDTSRVREHQIRLNDVRMAFTHGWQDPHLRVHSWDTQGVTLDTAGAQPGVRPDGIVLLEHAKARFPLVVLLEIDLGTEPLHRTGSQSCWLQKAEGYRDAGVVAGWRDWAIRQAKIESEAACRLAIVTTTVARLDGIGDLIQASLPSVQVWMTSQKELITSGPWSEIWCLMGYDGKRGFVARPRET